MSAFFDPLNITCPVMSALVKRGMLAPDCDGFVSKREVRTALMRFGISGKVTRETTDANFDHLPGDDEQKGLNLFAMNTIDNVHSARGDAIEHFRSTGIRDTWGGPSAARYAHFEAFKRHATDDFTQVEVSRAIAAFDVDPGYANVYGEPLSSNDINGRHPARNRCAPSASVTRVKVVDGEPDEQDDCHSNLWGSITFMFQELGTPTGQHARMSAAEMRSFWLEAELPQGVVDRSPATCYGAGRYGCGSCLEEYTTAPPKASYKATLRHRYCRCMMITDFELSGGFHPNATAEDIRLPGALGYLDSAYAATCTDAGEATAPHTAHKVHDHAGAALVEGIGDKSGCSPYCFAGGTPAEGHYGED